MTLPDQMYINHVRDALWSRARRASVMIGSGFSKNAIPNLPDVGALPLWDELAREMVKRLGSPSLAVSTVGLAQEYTTAFGRSGLHQFLQQQVRDRDFSPSEFHSRLLKLPWNDVFTTNWDTLLERTLPSVPERPYSVVHNKDEIPISTQPRIIKLHGSLDGHYPLIATEEDYRAYPKIHAPFVNTVQQSMMETVFLLIGFSGKDPNFLNWSSWVQENLGETAPKVFLAGWLELSDVGRECLRSRNVVAIDVARHPKAQQWPEHLRHAYATGWILGTLEGGRPYDAVNWPTLAVQSLPETPIHLQPVEVVTSDTPIEETRSPPKSDDSQSPEHSTHKILEIWRHNRSVYPGWLIAPLEVRSSLIDITHNWEAHILQVLSGLSTIERLNAIRELLWRYEITLEPVSSNLESEALGTFALIDCEARTIDGTIKPQIAWSEVREAYREVALTLVTIARHRLDESAFSQRIKMVEQFLSDDPNVSHRISHERCLWAAWALDFKSLDDLLADWNTDNSDPVWMLRKAALLNEVGRHEEANDLTGFAIAEIRRFPVDDRSVAGPSREGWGLWSTIDYKNRLGIFNRWNELASQKCNAYAEKAAIANALSTKPASTGPPTFDLDAIGTSTILFGTGRRVAPAYRAIRLSEVAGLSLSSPDTFPPRAPASDIVKSAADHLVIFDSELAVRLVVRACTYDKDETLMRILSPNHVALLQDDAAQRLVADCIRVVEFSLTRGWVEHIRVTLEVLSRLVPRLGSDSVLETFDYALNLYRNRQHQVMSHVVISDPLRNLLRRTWDSLPQYLRTRRVLDVLGAPIVGLDGFTAQIAEHHPDPGQLVSGDSRVRLPDRSDDNEAQWRDTISLLVRALHSGGEPRKRAATRLVPIVAKGLLTEGEAAQVADALWAAEHTPANSLPAGTTLNDWAFLVLPEPQTHLADQRFRAKWLTRNVAKSRHDISDSGGIVTVSILTSPDDPDHLEDTLLNVGLAISGLRADGRAFELTDIEIKHVASLVSQWASAPVSSHPDTLVQVESRRYTMWAVEGLVPILSKVEIPATVGEVLFEKLKSLTEAGIPVYRPIGSLVRIIPQHMDELANWLRTGLASPNRDIATGALSGLASWLHMSNSAGSSVDNPPKDIIRELGLIIATRRKESLSGALRVAKWVFDEGSDDLQSVVLNPTMEGLNYLSEELRYDSEYEDSDVRRLRWRCAQLALSMSRAGLKCKPAVTHWLELASTDPFPEVRYIMTG